MKLDSTLIIALLIPLWGLVHGLMALKKQDKKRAWIFLAPSGAMLLFILAVKLSGLANNVDAMASDASAPSASASTPTSSAPADAVEQELLTAANNVTKVAPQMLDAETRLDGAFAGPGHTFTYLYTLTKRAASQLKPGYFDAKVAPSLKRAGCASKQLQFFFDNKVEVTYKYRGSDGAPLGTVTMSRNTCPRKPAVAKNPDASAPEAQPQEEASAPASSSQPEPQPEVLKP